jgi:hypothetical protein
VSGDSSQNIGGVRVWVDRNTPTPGRADVTMQSMDEIAHLRSELTTLRAALKAMEDKYETAREACQRYRDNESGLTYQLANAHDQATTLRTQLATAVAKVSTLLEKGGHSVICNGDRRAPVTGCRWCDRDGKGFRFTGTSQAESFQELYAQLATANADRDAAVARADRLAEALAELEWAGTDTEGGAYCVFCNRLEDEGHRDGCAYHKEVTAVDAAGDLGGKLCWACNKNQTPSVNHGLCADCYAKGRDLESPLPRDAAGDIEGGTNGPA